MKLIRAVKGCTREDRISDQEIRQWLHALQNKITTHKKKPERTFGYNKFWPYTGKNLNMSSERKEGCWQTEEEMEPKVGTGF
jgi:hypothetical protein